MRKSKSLQSSLPNKETPLPNEIVDNSSTERRDFLRKLGKYSAVTSITTVTLMTANKASALSPPPPPADEGYMRD